MESVLGTRSTKASTMESAKLLQMLSTRYHSGDYFLYIVCKNSCLTFLHEVKTFLNKPIPRILAVRNNDGLQCTHIVAMVGNPKAPEMMDVVLSLGADINDQKMSTGSTPLHLCAWNRSYALAEWLCKAPGIDLEIRDYSRVTAYQTACEFGDHQMMAGAKCNFPHEPVRNYYDDNDSGYDSGSRYDSDEL